MVFETFNGLTQRKTSSVMKDKFLNPFKTVQDGSESQKQFLDNKILSKDEFENYLCDLLDEQSSAKFRNSSFGC